MTLQENMQKVAKAILGERPDVVMDLRDLKCSAYVAVAIIAHNECEALEYALELKAELINLWPAWRGLGIEYDLTRHIDACKGTGKASEGRTLTLKIR